MKKGVMYFTIFSFILILGIFAVNAALSTSIKSHSANDIRVRVAEVDRILYVFPTYDYSEMSLQEAVNQDLLINQRYSYQKVKTESPTSIQNLKTSANNVIVRVGNEDKTLTAAIGTLGICGSTGTYSPSTIVPPNGHLASQIEVTVNGQSKSLQDAVNAKELLYTSVNHSKCSDNDRYWYDSCGRQETKREECGTTGFEGVHSCGGGSTLGDRLRNAGDVTRKYFTYGCSGDSCTESSATQNVFDCSSRGDCRDYGDDYWSGIVCLGDSGSSKDFSQNGACSIDVNLNDFNLKDKDTCDRDEHLPFYCKGVKDNNLAGGCQDVYYASSCSSSGTDRLHYYVRKVYCFYP